MTPPRRRAPGRRATLPATLLLTLVLTLLGALAPSGAGAASDVPRTNTERFYAGEPYTGMFADPAVMRVGGRFYAVATNHDGLNLPLMSSTDLRTWRPRAPLTDYRRWTDWRGYNDALPGRPAWAASIATTSKPQFSQWAPSVARVKGRFVAAYSAAQTLETPRRPRRSCIGLAVADRAAGPYVPVSREPTVCYPPSPRGVIDPDLHVTPDGTAYLLWKQEGVVDRSEPKLMVQRLSADGLRLKAGSRPVELLPLVRGTWKGGVIENPSMVRHGGRTYLFYSAHDWYSADYATGYAECAGPLGPCVDRTHARPLLASDGAVKGPGGADAFTDREGRLRLAYAAWDPGRVGPGGTHARMLHVARLQRVGGALRVAERG